MASIAPTRQKIVRATSLVIVLHATLAACSASQDSSPTQTLHAEPDAGDGRRADGGSRADDGDAASDGRADAMADGGADAADAQGEGDAGQGDASSSLVHVGDVVLRTDADARALRGVTELRGSLTVHGDGTLASLEGLEQLTTVTGDLVVEESMALVSLDALRALGTVRGALRIGSGQTPVIDPTTKVLSGATPEDDNRLLATIALPALKTVGSLQILRNPALASITMGALDHVGGAFEISYCPMLTDLSTSFPVVKSIAGEVTIGRDRPSFHVSDDAGTRAVFVPARGNDALRVVEFPSLYIATSIGTFENPSLETLNLAYLQSLDGTLRTSAPTVDVRNLQTVNGALELYATRTLTSGSLRFVGSLTFSNLHMPSLGPLGALSRVGNLVILSSDLVSLQGLESLSTASEISIARSPLLTNTDGLRGLQRVDDAIEIKANATLTRVRFEQLTSVYDISLQSNPALDSVTFDALTGPIDALSIDTCRALTSVRAPLLTKASQLSVRGRGSRIATLDLGALRTLDGLSLYDGPTSLAPFAGLTQLGSVFIRTNLVAQVDLDAFFATLAQRGVVPTDLDARYSAFR